MYPQNNNKNNKTAYIIVCLIKVLFITAVCIAWIFASNSKNVVFNNKINYNSESLTLIYCV